MQRDEAEKQKNIIDLENRRAAAEVDFISKAEIELERLNILKDQEIQNAEATGGDIALINKKFAKQEEAINTSVQNNKLALTAQTFGQIAGLLKSESAAAKAFGIFQATIDTYLGANKALATLPAPFGAIQAGVTIATGLANVAKISGAKFEKGGLQEIGGKRHIAGGTKFMGEDGTAFEAEKGELIGVMNRNAAQHFMAFNNAFPNGNSTPSFFQGGGVISQGVSAQSLDTNELAEITAEAVASVPAPIVTVEDINAGQVRTVEVESGADL
ncbi:MAG: hypothetical protein ACW972_08280 [Promethearchaeota archaeon]